MPQIAKVVPPTPTVVETPFDPNQVDCNATADSQSEILIIPPGQVSLNSDDIAKLHAHGLEADNNNEPVPENAGPHPVQEQQGVWTVPTTYHRKAAGISNLKGRWVNHPWS